MARAVGRYRAAPGRRVHRLARVRRAPADPATVFHAAGRRPGPAGPRHRGLASCPPGGRAHLRVARRSDRPRPAHGHRAPGDRHLQLPATRLHGAARVHPPARRCRPRHGCLRSSRARLPDRRNAPGSTGRGVRVVRRRSDGWSAPGPGDRCDRCESVRRDLVRLRVRRRCGARGGDPDRPPRPRDGRSDPSVARREHHRVPAECLVHGRSRRRRCGRRPTSAHGPVRTRSALEPRPRRRSDHQRRRLLRWRDLRSDLEPLPDPPRSGAGLRWTHVRDVRPAGAAALAVRRPIGRSARFVRVHRHRLHPAGRDRDPVHPPDGPNPGAAAHHGRGDRFRDA